jgi:hypothetical protein
MANIQSVSDVEAAVALLKRTGRGRSVMRDLLGLSDRGGVGLDAGGQEAVYTLLSAVWGPYTGTARDVMRDAVGD